MVKSKNSQKRPSSYCLCISERAYMQLGDNSNTGSWRRWFRGDILGRRQDDDGFQVAGVLFYQVAVSIRCILFLPLRSRSALLSTRKLVNQRLHVTS
jgi:hypothetical protein